MARTFVKDGRERVAASPAQAVRLKFDGWREIKPTPAAAVEAVEPPTPDENAGPADPAGETTSDVLPLAVTPEVPATPEETP